MTSSLDALPLKSSLVIPADKAAELQATLQVSAGQLLLALVPLARQHARPPISQYMVGAAGLSRSGRIYLGVNLEFPGNALNQTVHAEQFSVVSALQGGESGLDMLAVSAPPCGHCRQWLNELVGGADLKILTPDGSSTPLEALLPSSFGPRDLGVSGGVFTPQEHQLRVEGGDDALVTAALKAANSSYSPYSMSASGVALRLADGATYCGRYVENAAFNPSLSPLQCALVAMVADGRAYDDIVAAALVEAADAPVSQQAATRSLLESVQPKATLVRVPAR